eukprot:Clim_evm27s251 gene=Clim_evmTU27s251
MSIRNTQSAKPKLSGGGTFEIEGTQLHDDSGAERVLRSALSRRDFNTSKRKMSKPPAWKPHRTAIRRQSLVGKVDTTKPVKATAYRPSEGAVGKRSKVIALEADIERFRSERSLRQEAEALLKYTKQSNIDVTFLVLCRCHLALELHQELDRTYSRERPATSTKKVKDDKDGVLSQLDECVLWTTEDALAVLENYFGGRDLPKAGAECRYEALILQGLLVAYESIRAIVDMREPNPEHSMRQAITILSAALHQSLHTPAGGMSEADQPAWLHQLVARMYTLLGLVEADALPMVDKSTNEEKKRLSEELSRAADYIGADPGEILKDLTYNDIGAAKDDAASSGLAIVYLRRAFTSWARALPSSGFTLQGQIASSGAGAIQGSPDFVDSPVTGAYGAASTTRPTFSKDQVALAYGAVSLSLILSNRINHPIRLIQEQESLNPLSDGNKDAPSTASMSGIASDILTTVIESRFTNGESADAWGTFGQRIVAETCRVSLRLGMTPCTVVALRQLMNCTTASKATVGPNFQYLSGRLLTALLLRCQSDIEYPDGGYSLSSLDTWVPPTREDEALALLFEYERAEQLNARNTQVDRKLSINRTHSLLNPLADDCVIACGRSGMSYEMTEILDQFMVYSFQNSHLWSQTGLALTAAGVMPKKALRTLSQALIASPDDPALALAACSACLEDDVDDPLLALEYANKAFAINERLPEDSIYKDVLIGRMWYLKGVAQMQQSVRVTDDGERKEAQSQAVHCFHQAVSRDPDDYEATYCLALAYASIREIPRAIKYCVVALDSPGSNRSTSYYLYANLLTSQKKYHAALDLIHIAMSEFPVDLPMQILKSRIELALQMPNDALKTLLDLMQHWRDNDLFYENVVVGSAAPGGKAAEPVTFDIDPGSQSHSQGTPLASESSMVPLSAGSNSSTSLRRRNMQLRGVRSLVSSVSAKKGTRRGVHDDTVVYAPAGMENLLMRKAVHNASKQSGSSEFLPMSQPNPMGSAYGLDVASSTGPTGSNPAVSLSRVDTASNTSSGNAASSVAAQQKMSERLKARIGSLVLIWLEIADVYLHMERLDEATQAVAEARRYTPFSCLAYMRQGDIFMRKNMIEEAERCYHKALAIIPGQGDALIRLATVFEAQGQFKNAEKYLRDALVVKPTSHLAWYHLGSLYSRQAVHDKSTECLETSMLLDRSSPLVDFEDMPLIVA